MSGPSNWLPMNKMQPAEASQFRPIQPALPSQSLALSTAHSEEQVGMKRNRTKRACDTCRKRKMKCEVEEGPNCTRCIEANQTCVFSISTKRRGAPRTYVERLESRLKDMEKLLSDQAKKAMALEISSIMIGPQPRYVGDMSILPFLAQKINFEDARIASSMGVHIRRFGQNMVMYDKTDPNGKDANHKQLEERGMLEPGETIKDLNEWIYKVAGIDKRTSDILLKVFFAYIYPGLPVINKGLFLRQYRGKIKGYPSAPLLNAMYGSAVRYIETCRTFGDDVLDNETLDIPKGWSEKLFDNVISYVKGKCNPNISTVQAIILCHFHSASLDGNIASGWLLNSVVIRSAQDLGLHRSCESWEISECEKETRRRVWWAVYLLDKWSAAATGKPQTIFDEDCDEVYPSANASWTEVMDETDDDIDGPRFPSLDSQLAQHIDTAQVPVYQPFVQLCKLTEILSKILQYLYTPQAKRYSSQFGSDKIISHLDKALSEWRLGLPPGLQLSSINVRRLEGKKTTPLISVSGLIYLSYCTLLILLHRPFIEKDSTHSSALNICVSAAIRCIDIAEKMNYSDFFLASWSFAIYPIFTASLVHIYNTSNPDIIVSDVAKSNLIKLFKTVKKLTDVSQGAIKLKTLLTEVLKEHNMDIPLEENEEDSEPSTSTNNTGSTEWQKERPAINKRLSFIPHPFNTNVESEMSKCFTENPILSCTSAPHPHLNENWINELSYSLKTTPVANTDPYSQCNFGLNNSMPTEPGQFCPEDNIFALTGNHQDLNQDGLFQNRPDNPFWSIPSTMELDDWSSYLSSLNTRWM